MALTAQQQALYDWAKAAVPRWLFDAGRSEEELNAFTLIFDQEKTSIDTLLAQTYILTATGVWLTQHALDRGSDRQDGESDATLRARLRVIQDALTRVPVLEVAQAAWTDAGFAGTVVMVELRRTRAYLITNEADTGTGGTFVGPDASNVMTFEPTAGFAGRPWDDADVPPRRAEDHYLVIANATAAGNDGTFEITGFDDDAVQYTNAAGVAAAPDAAADWRIERRDWQGISIDGATGSVSPPNGFQDAYLDRGFRIGNAPPNTFIIILPYDVTAAEADRAVVEEAVRLKKAAGNPVIVERRANP